MRMSQANFMLIVEPVLIEGAAANVQYPLFEAFFDTGFILVIRTTSYPDRADRWDSDLQNIRTAWDYEE